MRISQGQYGQRQATPRIRALLQREAIPATFFYPAVSALLHPDEVRGMAEEGHEIGIHSWIHEANTTLPREAERDLTFRAAETLSRIAGRDPVGMRTASWDFSVNTLDIVREMKLLYDSSLMADDDPYELTDGGEPTGIVELPPEWIRDDAVYYNFVRFSALRPVHAALRGGRDLHRRVRRRVGGRRTVPAHHAPAHHRSPLPHAGAGAADQAHEGTGKMLVRHPCAGGAMVPGSGVRAEAADVVWQDCAGHRRIWLTKFRKDRKWATKRAWAGLARA